MIYILTSNPINSTNPVKEYVDNFIFVITHTQTIYPMNPPKTQIVYEIYCQKDSGYEDDYESSEDFVFNFHFVRTVSEALDQISQFMSQEELTMRSKDEDLQEEITFGCTTDYNANKQIIRYLNNQFSEYSNENDQDIELRCLDVFNFLKIPSMKVLTEKLKTVLNTQFIYPDDPIAFGYALIKALGAVL